MHIIGQNIENRKAGNCNWMLDDISALDLSEAGAASLDVVDQPTKLSTSAVEEDCWDDTESETSEQQSRKVKETVFTACIRMLRILYICMHCFILSYL